jgi:cobalt-zinc-cadmium efflux system membrane fusion protein
MKNLLNYGLFLVVLAACSDKTPTENEHTHAEIGDVIELSQGQLQQIRLQTAKAEIQIVHQEISLNGTIELPPQYLADLNPPLPGYVVELRVKGGEAVKKGQVLAVLEHPEYIELQRRFLEAKSLLSLSESELNRQRELSSADATTVKIREQAENNFRIQQANAAALSAQLQRLGIQPEQLSAEKITPQIRLLAPFSGYVDAIDGAIGRFVPADKPLIRLVNPDHMHVELRLYEKDLSRVQLGQKLTFSPLNEAQKSYSGDIFLISPTVDAVNRTVNIHGHIDRAGSDLRPGMFVKANIQTQNLQEATLPQAALVGSGDEQVVFEQLATGKYKRLPVVVQGGNRDVVVIPQLDTAKLYVVAGAEYLEAYYQQLLAPEEGGGH